MGAFVAVAQQRPAPAAQAGDGVEHEEGGQAVGSHPAAPVHQAVEQAHEGWAAFDEGAKAGGTAKAKGVTILGHLNVAGRIAATASSLYARNLYAFVETMIDKETKALNVKWDDEIITATLLTRGGKTVHPAFSGKEGE